jgi:hypothetical protein
MITITNTDDITAAFADFNASADGAYATCRCLPGQYASENQQEWAEHGTIQGKDATVYYLFKNSEAEVEDVSDMPFDAAHISHIVIAA